MNSLCRGASYASSAKVKVKQAVQGRAAETAMPRFLLWTYCTRCCCRQHLADHPQNIALDTQSLHNFCASQAGPKCRYPILPKLLQGDCSPVRGIWISSIQVHEAQQLWHHLQPGTHKQWRCNVRNQNKSTMSTQHISHQPCQHDIIPDLQLQPPWPRSV